MSGPFDNGPRKAYFESMKTGKAARLIFAVWMVLVIGANAALSVCSAPCCSVSHAAAVAEGHSAGGHGCCGAAASDAEAEAFFADLESPEYYSIESEPHFKEAGTCVTPYFKASEYAAHSTSPAPDFTSLQTPLVTAYPLTDTPAGLPSVLRLALDGHPPAAPPIFLAVNSFLC